jgi:hypothetical protein
MDNITFPLWSNKSLKLKNLQKIIRLKLLKLKNKMEAWKIKLIFLKMLWTKVIVPATAKIKIKNQKAWKTNQQLS